MLFVLAMGYLQSPVVIETRFFDFFAKLKVEKKKAITKNINPLESK